MQQNKLLICSEKKHIGQNANNMTFIIEKRAKTCPIKHKREGCH